jgi:hypothetical protein
MNYSLARALLSQPEGIPSLVDIWYFVSFLAVIATVFAFFLKLKKKGSDNYRVCGFIIGFLFLAMFVFYDPFLVAKSKSLLKALLSTWLIVTSIILGVFTFNFLYLCCFWKSLTAKRRIFSAINGTTGFVMSILTMNFALSLS